MLALISSKLGLTAIAIALVLAVIGVQTARLSMANHKIASMEAAQKLAEANVKTHEAAATVISSKASVDNQAAQTKIVTVTKTVIQRVPTYVTAKTNAAYPWPVGAVRLYNASLGFTDVPDPSGRPNDASSGLGAADAAAVFIPNNGACRADQERLSALQGWVRNQQQSWNAKP